MKINRTGLGFQNAGRNDQMSPKKRAFYWIVKICLIIVLYSSFTVLFHRQAMEYGGGYRSDLPLHIRSGIDGGD